MVFLFLLIAELLYHLSYILLVEAHNVFQLPLPLLLLRMLLSPLIKLSFQFILTLLLFLLGMMFLLPSILSLMSCIISTWIAWISKRLRHMLRHRLLFTTIFLYHLLKFQPSIQLQLDLDVLSLEAFLLTLVLLSLVPLALYLEIWWWWT